MPSITITEQSAGSLTISNANTLTGSGRIVVEETIAASQTNKLVAFALDVSACKAFFISADQDVLLETNDGGAPDDTISLKSGIPYVWYTNKYDAFQLTVDVTALYFTTTPETTVKIEAVYDATP